jgi:serine protease Do
MFPFQFQMPQQAQPYKRRSHGQGSGAIISPDGYIITNNHVVEGVKSCRVTMSDGSELEGKVVGTDPKTDLALIKVTSATPATRGPTG